jgi:hypothetical protein
VQPTLGGELEAAFFSDSHEVTKVPQLHRRPYTSQAYRGTYKVFPAVASAA